MTMTASRSTEHSASTLPEALIDELRPAYEAFYQRSGEEVYAFRAGLKDSLDLEQILRDYPVLSSKETLEKVRELERTGDAGSLSEPIQLFSRICLDRRLEEESASEIVKLEEAQAREGETVDGQRQSFFAATLVAAATGEREKRNRLALAHGAMCRRLLTSLIEKWSTQEAAARSTGFPTYLAASARIRRVDPRATVRALRHALDPRFDQFHAELKSWLDRTGNRTPDGRIEVHDLWHLWNADLGDSAFSSDRLLPALESTLQGMGLDLYEEGKIVLDVESRPAKNPRAFCAPVVVPDKVYLVIQPVGGSRDYSQLFHEAGHALHFSRIDPALPMEWKDGAGYALTESYAFLFEHLIHDPLWLEEFGGQVDREGFVRLSNLRNEYILRRLTAEIEAQIDTEGQPEQRPARVAETFRGMIGLTVDASAASFYIDDGLYAAEYARGFAFVARLREHLRSAFGRRFWRNPKAGEFLRELWASGNRYDTESMSQRLWGESLGYEAFANELSAAPAA